MPQILFLKTLHCDVGTSDKVYGVLIVKNDNSSFYNLITFHGPRGKTLDVRTERGAPIATGMSERANEIVRSKTRKGYRLVDWWLDSLGMKSTILSLGTPPGSPPQPEAAPPPASTKPTAPSTSTSARPPRKSQPTESAWAFTRSARDDELDI